MAELCEFARETRDFETGQKIDELGADHHQVSALRHLGPSLSVCGRPITGHTAPEGELPPTLCVLCSRRAVGPKIAVVTTPQKCLHRSISVPRCVRALKP